MLQGQVSFYKLYSVFTAIFVFILLPHVKYFVYSIQINFEEIKPIPFSL